MLRQLSLRDFVIVDALDIEFEPGFTVLTGETGAGKSILVDALALALGERGDASVVREGALRAEISAEFDCSGLPGLQDWLAESALDDDATCLLRRVVDSNGRSRCFINGRSVTAQQLREAGEFLVDIHGQHAHQSLLKTAAQRDLLDSYGGLQPLVRQVADAYRHWRDLHDRLSALRDNSSGLDAERERLHWLVTDMDTLQFTQAGWDELQAEHRRLANAASLMEGVGLALDVLSEGETAAEQQISAVSARLASLADYDSDLQPARELVESAALQLQEATHSLRRYLDHLEADPARLNEVEARIEQVLDTARKYRVKAEQLPDLLASAQTRLSELGATADPAALEQAARGAREQWLAHAAKLSTERTRAAGKLAASVSLSMQQLALAGGTFEIGLTPLAEGNAHGLEQVEFMVAPHPGTAPKALAKVASGGELSRISLALQTAVSQVAGVPTLIFDEVDVGIGGGVAEIVGTLLKNLAGSRQVLCITHLPQVAACGQQHLQVSKAARDGGVVSHITALDASARVDEIARMLGGVTITETTRKHAAEMLNS
ncbi:DNA repair protein RecN [Sulfuriferula plumbiphila]|uniref:DNA repair protein RecN n=1 Tax=Sulfuriferula plumbiphila TaxID=171865 RepID=A0A512L7T0_9PROT|nr:DNA repair protein RecN [Sulfuriferula plumbiphila]BBP03959.1 DNA repair protein RecN [Sulfuriferula plumbiphila]GEP30524.1 DNA repair protein RecN [Sulfuriferula plumbiphila]